MNQSSSPDGSFSAHAFSWSGCSAIITGASSGLGGEFAVQLAAEAAHLLLVARSREPMDRLAERLRSDHPNLQVHVCAADLATDEGRAALWSAVDAAGLRPNVLINNAGLGDYGEFAEAPVAKVRLQIDLNITALTLLTHEFLQRLNHHQIRPAGLLQVSSLASTLPMPALAVYAATKAYVSSFSEALAVELREKGVSVLAVCPGPTPTNFSKTARRESGRDTNRAGQGFLVMPPERVVSEALSGLVAGKACVFPGRRVTLAATIFRAMPRFLMRPLLKRRHRSETSGVNAAPPA